MWPAAPVNVFAGQVEQETCITLTHRSCWNPRAELKTEREYGFGLGQITITSRFNNFRESVGSTRALQGWVWEDRFNPRMQLIAMVSMDLRLFNSLWFPGHSLVDENSLAFALAAYNGGLGGVLADKRLCAQTYGCNPGMWFGHVEQHSLKAKVAVSGYGKSFFAINREYVRNILKVRRWRYGTIP